jgi:hypothetical protein
MTYFFFVFFVLLNMFLAIINDTYSDIKEEVGTLIKKEIKFSSYRGRGKFMPLPLKSKILETPGFLVTDYIKMFPL